MEDPSDLVVASQREYMCVHHQYKWLNMKRPYIVVGCGRVQVLYKRAPPTCGDEQPPILPPSPSNTINAIMRRLYPRYSTMLPLVIRRILGEFPFCPLCLINSVIFVFYMYWYPLKHTHTHTHKYSLIGKPVQTTGDSLGGNFLARMKSRVSTVNCIHERDIMCASYCYSCDPQ